MDQLEEKDLLKHISQGSEEALETFYNTFEMVVYSFALCRLRNEFEAAECLNEVMTEVWIGAHRFEEHSKVKSWLLGITNFKVTDRLRKRGKQTAESLEESTLVDDNCTVADAIAGLEDADKVRKCIENLSDSHRQAVHLTFFEGLSYPEIAQIVECSQGTIKTRMFHAKQKLKHCLAQVLAANS
jgi:RNA polymerase sigma-70 factor (ECF subfamily)